MQADAAPTARVICWPDTPKRLRTHLVVGLDRPEYPGDIRPPGAAQSKVVRRTRTSPEYFGAPTSLPRKHLPSDGACDDLGDRWQKQDRFRGRR